MALIRRVSRLFAADVHAVLDHIEDPESVLKQAIREMEEELARQIQRGKWLAKEIETVVGRIEAHAKTRAELDAKLDLCFANGNEALARRLTRRKLEGEKLLERHQANRAALEEALAEHRALVASNEDQLEGMRQKAALLCSDRGARAQSEPAGIDGFGGVDDDEVEIAFLHEKQKRTQS